MNNIHHTTKGFTLLETLASITILSFVIIGPLAVLTGSSAYARQTKDTIIATHLAEEGIELLQNQYDSIYLLCKKDPGNVYCTASGAETSGQTSWRLFKDQFVADNPTDPLEGNHPSCYLSNNSYGCSYDYLSMAGAVTDKPVRYAANKDNCAQLVELTVTTTKCQYRDQGGDYHDITCSPGSTQNSNIVSSTAKRHTYVCKSVADAVVQANPTNATTSSKSFARTISLEALPTFELGAMDTQYNDDLRVSSVVTYKGVNGVTFPIKVVRFMHAQP